MSGSLFKIHNFFFFTFFFFTFILYNLVRTLQYVLNFFFFFAHKKLKKTSLKSCSEKLKYTFFPLLPWAAQTTQTEEFMFQSVAYRPTVYRTGAEMIYICNQNSEHWQNSVLKEFFKNHVLTWKVLTGKSREVELFGVFQLIQSKFYRCDQFF